MNTQTKHTEGPYIAKPAILSIKDPMFYKADVIAGRIRVAVVAGIGEDCANANARLISAAPELLEACKFALNFIMWNDSQIFNGYEDLKKDLKHVIEKSEGNPAI